MGGSASKGARQLPKSVPSAVRSAPEWAKTSGLPTEQPLPDRSAAPPFSPSSSSSASGSASRTPTRDDQRPDGSRSQSQRQDMLSHGRMESGSSMSREHQVGRQVGRAHANFSGDKDDVVVRDSIDPDFAANLSRLGQVSIHNAGKFIPTQSSAQRTLNSRRDELLDATALPPPGHLTSTTLNQLFDDLKTVRTDTERKRLYARYGMDEETMRVLRKWTNSPSVGDVETVNVEGEEVTEMKALWVDGK